MNAIGVALFAWRSYEIGETAFLAVNVVTGSFWVLVLLVKAGGSGKGREAFPFQAPR